MEERRHRSPAGFHHCNNTSTSKLVYDFISGFKRKNNDDSETYVGGRFELFRNYDEYGNRLARPRTLLIDSTQLESGDALDKEFRTMAADEIERFRRDLVIRKSDPHAGDKLTDQDLLREVMNTVGKPGRLGEQVRCVVSVSMLTEGWDTSTVTHILGVRAFGTAQALVSVLFAESRRANDDAAMRLAWLRYSRWLVAGLTVQLAADILETSATPSWDDIGRLAAIAVIRTFLNYFLERDLSEAQDRQKAKP